MREKHETLKKTRVNNNCQSIQNSKLTKDFENLTMEDVSSSMIYGKLNTIVNISFNLREKMSYSKILLDLFQKDFNQNSPS